MAKANVREKVVTAGLEQLHQRGYNGCSVEDITGSAGVPKGSFYNHFKSKEDLAVEVIGRYVELGPHEILDDSTIAPLARIQQYFAAKRRDFVESEFKKGCLLGNLAGELADHSVAVRDQLLRAFSTWMSRLSHVIREGQERGEISSKRDPDQLSGALINSWEGALLRARVSADSRAVDDFLSFGLPYLLEST
jgi:TetR/AcrR family transcriptional regulator, transcriptional repressor for nem operon